MFVPIIPFKIQVLWKICLEKIKHEIVNWGLRNIQDFFYRIQNPHFLCFPLHYQE